MVDVKNNDQKYLVFISHSSKDLWIARQMVRLIEEKGKDCNVQVFLDEKDIEIGKSIPESVRKNIQECNEFLVLLTPYSINQPWVLIEIGGAWTLGKRIVAVVDKITPEEMPDIIVLDKAIELNDFDKYLEQLLNRVKEAKQEK